MTAPIESLKAALAARYTIEGELGQGGMATVYLAEDLKHHRKVAIKVLRPDLAATMGPERFIREITVAANLQHPHVLPLYDSGEAGGFLFYVMPYVDGPSLRQKLIREGELPVADAVRILRDVADALAYSHEQEVVHRDIKPENVMLSGRHALVADFGVAKAVSEATGRQQLTTAGVALGTPAYMAPEQAAADPHMDHRADIYAFGALAYELLTGRPPFVGPTPQAVLAAHVTSAAEPVTQHRATIPPALAALVMKCLEKKPADRWQTAAELLPQLEFVLTPSGGMTPTATVPVTATPPSRWRPWILVGSAAGVVAATLLLIFGLRTLRGGQGKAETGTVAVFPFATRSADSADVWLGEGLSEQIGSRLARLSQVRVLSTNAVAAQQRSTPDPLQAGRALNVRWVVSGTLRHAEGAIHARVEVARAASGIQAWSSSFDRTDGDFEALQREVAESVAVVLVGRIAPAPPTNPQATRATDPEAYRLFLIGNALLNRRTPETAMEAVANYQEAVRRDPQFAAAWAQLGAARIVQFSWSLWPAPDVPKDSLPALARHAADVALAVDSVNARAISVLGQIATWADRDFVTARREFDRALRLDSTDATIWHSYGVALGTDGANDLPASERLLRRALAIDPDQPNTWRHLANTVAWQGRLAEAEAILDTLVALGPWAPALYGRAYVRFLRGNGLGALDDLRAASAVTGNDPDAAAVALFSIATGDREPALGWLARGDTASANVATINMALGRRQAALDALGKRKPGVGTWGLLHDPIFAPLQNDPRFVRMLEESRPPGVR